MGVRWGGESKSRRATSPHPQSPRADLWEGLAPGEAPSRVAPGCQGSRRSPFGRKIIDRLTLYHESKLQRS